MHQILTNTFFVLEDFLDERAEDSQISQSEPELRGNNFMTTHVVRDICSTNDAGEFCPLHKLEITVPSKIPPKSCSKLVSQKLLQKLAITFSRHVLFLRAKLFDCDVPFFTAILVHFPCFLFCVFLFWTYGWILHFIIG